MRVCVRARACMCVCVRARMRARVRACVCACVRVCVRAAARARMCVHSMSFCMCLPTQRSVLGHGNLETQSHSASRVRLLRINNNVKPDKHRDRVLQNATRIKGSAGTHTRVMSD